MRYRCNKSTSFFSCSAFIYSLLANVCGVCLLKDYPDEYGLQQLNEMAIGICTGFKVYITMWIFTCYKV